MDIEAKLDDDFLFYTNFTGTFLKRIPDHDVFKQCRNWIFKLCTEPYEGIKLKRCRNMYLANLLVHMQTGKLEEPFLQPPFYVDISNAMQVFGNIPDTVEQPAWLNDSEFIMDHQESHEEKPGRTYFAIKTLPHGQGAFAYIGVSLTGDDWINRSMAAGDQSSPQRQQAMDQQLGQQYHAEVPPIYEMEKILAKRKNPKEREKVLTFYDTLLQIVADELNGKTPEFNETIEGLLEQLVQDLKVKGQYACCYENLNEYDQRMELLMTLYDRIKIRRDKVAKREEILDDIEQKVIPHLFDVSQIEPDDVYQLPASMWQQVIEKMPNRKQMEELKKMYPIPVVERFVVFLASFKEEITERMHRRHEKIASQMKKELRKEGTKGKADADRMVAICLDTEEIYKAVSEYFNKKMELEEQNRNQFKIPVSEHSRLYEELRTASLDTQQLVEEEAARGKFLAEQINSVFEANETVKEINEGAIRKCEHANANILRNIKRLNHAIKQYESRVSEIKHMGDNTKKTVQRILAGKNDD